MIVWITGLSGSGKTTLALALKERLKKDKNLNPVLLDGDALREVMDLASQGYEPAERKTIAFTYAKLAKLLSDQGFLVIVATISMFEDVRRWNRDHNMKYLEIYLKVPLEERKRRKNKCSGDSQVELSAVYEEPSSPDLVVDFEKDFLLESYVIFMIDKVMERDL